MMTKFGENVMRRSCMSALSAVMGIKATNTVSMKPNEAVPSRNFAGQYRVHCSFTQESHSTTNWQKEKKMAPPYLRKNETRSMGYLVTSEREARSEFLLIYTKNLSMSGRPAGRGHAFERLISLEPSARLTSGLLWWVTPSLLPCMGPMPNHVSA